MSTDTRPDRGAKPLPSVPQTAAGTALNAVVQQALQPLLLQGRQSRVVVRCSELPEVKGDPQLWQEAFGTLLQTIVAHTPAKGRLYLHIDCEKVEAAALLQGRRLLHYQLQFYTNIPATDEWFRAWSNSIEACSRLFSQLQASLSVNHLAGTGCLYIIQIPVQQ